LRDISKDILFEDNHLIIINKHSSDIVQGDKTGDIPLSELVKIFLKKKYNKPGDAFIGVVHRLDRPVSGAVIFAKTSKALARMNKMIKDGQLDKTYLAVVEKRPPETEDKLVNYLKKNPKQNKSYVVKQGAKDAKRAELIYKHIASGKTYHLVEVKLLTGRHHQIRAQLSNIGCVIKGDLKYGAKRSNPNGSISLHARKITFVHPVKKEKMSVTAPVPDSDEWKWFDIT
jgi:23S rRNA pseudouridine1911/1915/1917 synthase